ncbi:MAG: hypothetical protein FWE19_00560 [Oscillospiraceae bacterium]|nr:hypothetical protein [Oscillospiraceae bacterium]
MNQLALALRDFWHNTFVDTFGRPTLPGASARLPGTTIPAFLEGYARVPAGIDKWESPPYPYIVYKMERPDFGQDYMITGTIWDRTPTNPGNMGLVNDVLGQVEKRIPHGGVVLRLNDDSGTIWIKRGAPFFSFPQGDPDDPTIVRGVVNLVVQSHIK